MTTDSELLARVEAATGPDRELDALLGELAGLSVEGHDWRAVMKLGTEFAVGLAQKHQSIWSSALPRYTASIDAALALVERLLPNTGIDLHWVQGDEPEWDFDIWLSPKPITGSAATAPLAILAALLKSRSLPSRTEDVK